MMQYIGGPTTLWGKATEKLLRVCICCYLQNLPKTWVVTSQFYLVSVQLFGWRVVAGCWQRGSPSENFENPLPAASGLGNQTRWWQTGHEASFSCHDQRRLLPPDYFLAADKLLSGQHDNRRPTSLFSPASHHLHRQTPRENDETARVHRILVVSWGKSNCIVLSEILPPPSHPPILAHLMTKVCKNATCDILTETEFQYFHWVCHLFAN